MTNSAKAKPDAAQTKEREDEIKGNVTWARDGAEQVEAHAAQSKAHVAQTK